jgi:hypothetical protein
VLDQFGTTSPDRIAMANRQIRNQSVASISRRLADARTRQQLSVIDELIALLEERNLDGERRIDQVVRKWLRRLETEIGTPVPRRVLRARNTVRLHGALLDWMETALDELIPERCRLSGDS